MSKKQIGYKLINSAGEVIEELESVDPETSEDFIGDWINAMSNSVIKMNNTMLEIGKDLINK